MNPGPLRRLAGILGLLALLPTAGLLTLGWIAPLDAAIRGVVTAVAVIVVARVAGWWLRTMAVRFERGRTSDDGEQAASPASG